MADKSFAEFIDDYLGYSSEVKTGLAGKNISAVDVLYVTHNACSFAVGSYQKK